MILYAYREEFSPVPATTRSAPMFTAVAAVKDAGRSGLLPPEQRDEGCELRDPPDAVEQPLRTDERLPLRIIDDRMLTGVDTVDARLPDDPPTLTVSRPPVAGN